MIALRDVFKFYHIHDIRRVVLDHVSVNFQPGRSYAILGMNGAGKSTLMRLLAGAELPNSGRIRRSIRVSWPLGFSGGLHKSLTARENCQFVARIYGEDVRKVVKFVEDFAEIGAYFEAPVGTYSSGMLQRVAFGLSMAIDFDCYLIDETMSVGDGRFRDRCKHEFQIRKARSDIIMTSHSISIIRQYCDRVAVLVKGQLELFDNVEDAITKYNQLNMLPR